MERVQVYQAPPPVRGLLDGLDPALPDELYPPTAAPDLENIRVSGGKWETRLGSAVAANGSGTAIAAPGSGTPNYLADHAVAAGTRYRLYARGGTVYALTEPSGSFAAVTSGSGLHSTNRYHGLSYRDLHYLTDRSGALKSYTAGSPGTLATVANVARPNAAPTVKALTYRVLEDWGSLWTASDGANTPTADVTGSADQAPPVGDSIIRITWASSGSGGDRVYDATSSKEFLSHTVGFYARSTREGQRVQFEVGQTGPREYKFPLTMPRSGRWYAFFAQVGNLPSSSYRQFVVNDPNGESGQFFVTDLLLPGRLAGKYQWRYTHYNPTTGRESEPSDATEAAVGDFSHAQIDTVTTAGAAFKKAAGLYLPGDGVAGTTKMRVYRSGGVPSLTVDARGQRVWLRVGEITEVSTTLSANATKNATTLTLTSTTGMAAGDWLVLNPSSESREFVQILTVDSATQVTIRGKVGYETDLAGGATVHSSGATVVVGFVDNISNEALAGSTDRIDLERDDPPQGLHWLARDGGGRLWGFRHAGQGGSTPAPMGVVVSNRPTADRPLDYEIFPDGVDPLTRQNLLQGWRFNVDSESPGDEIVWGGMFRGVPTVLTRRALYQVYAYSQTDWGPTAVVRLLEQGCLAGETVQEVGGALYWVADGPRVLRWDGSGAPEDLSFQRVSETLEAAPSAYWGNWTARAHAAPDGLYYRLNLTPSGATTNTLWLDYNVAADAWEGRKHYDGAGAARAWTVMNVQNGPGDTRSFWAAEGAGTVYHLERPGSVTDAGTPIKLRFTTKRYAMGGGVGQFEQFYLRLTAATDALTCSVLTGGSEYGNTTRAFNNISLSGSGDVETKRRGRRSQKGRWVQFTFTGDVSNRPALRDLHFWFSPVRLGRTSR